MRRYVLLACLAAAVVVVAAAFLMGDGESRGPGVRPIQWDVAVVDPAGSGIRVLYWAVMPTDSPELIVPRYARVQRTPTELRVTLIGPDLEPARVQNADSRAWCVLVPISIAPGMELRDGSDNSLAVAPNAMRRASVMRTTCPRVSVREPE